MDGCIRQRIPIELRYDVYFTTGAFDPGNPVVREALAGGTGRVLALVEREVARAHATLLAAIQAYFASRPPVLVLPGGEACKNRPDGVAAVHAAIERHGLCRHASVLAVGGGAFLDMVGFAAATAHRGIRLVRLPTTTLGQADAGLGVKNAINAFGKKNFLGTFTPPHAVINDAAFLGTLPMREWRAGAAEAVKVALIKDAAFFAWLELRAEAIARRDPPAMHQLIRRCAELHLDHIARGGDPFERGSSRPLDFGHWAAHRLEAMSAHALGHGEAVAIGIALDATYAWQRGWLPAGDHARILAVMRQLGFRLAAPELGDPEALFRGLDEFREHLGGRLTLLMPAGIGRTFEVHEVDHAAMGAAVAWLIADDARERSSAA